MAAPNTAAWRQLLLKAVSAPDTPQNELYLTDWQRAEGGSAANNPFNTTEPGYGATGNYNSVGVKNYASPQQGLAATAATLENGRYGNILAALRQGTDAKAAAAALAASPWGTGSLVQKMLGSAQIAPLPATQGQQPPVHTLPDRPNTGIAAALKLLGFAAPAGLPAVARPPAVQPPASTQSGPTGRVLGATKGEQAGFLNDLARLAQFEHAPVQINSGYRSLAEQQQLWNNRASNPNPVARPGMSLHEQGLAADGTVGGVPLGKIPAAILKRFGLAPVPGDPVHVQVLR